jgi:hypothetical protein
VAGVNDSYAMANANRCTSFPQHIMVNQGRVEELFADVYRCDCGQSALGNSDESKRRTAP